jgi:hypothetical protein
VVTVSYRKRGDPVKLKEPNLALMDHANIQRVA